MALHCLFRRASHNVQHRSHARALSMVQSIEPNTVGLDSAWTLAFQDVIKVSASERLFLM